MIIQGHPDILLGPRGLNGLHGFGSLPMPGTYPRSEAYNRFRPENGGLGVDVLYQEIRDFVTARTSNSESSYAEQQKNKTEIEQAMIASGVSDLDVANAFAVPNPAEVQPTFSESYFYEPPAPVPTAYVSSAYTRFLPENGGKGIDVLYQEIRDFVTARTSNSESSYAEQQKNKTEIEQAMIASGVSDVDIANAFAQPIVDTKEGYTFEQFCPPGSMLVNGVCVGDPSTYSPDINAAPSAQEIRDFVSNNSQADILAAMARTGVTQSDIIRAFKEVDAALPTGQSPAVTRYLPENGGLGLDALYKEILDYQNTHTLNELLAQMQRSGVSMKDVDAANNYAFGKQQSQAPAEYAAAQAAQAAAAQAAAQAAQRAAAAAAAAAAAKAQATAAPTKVFTATGQSPAYTRFLPENGGKGIPALYKEIRDFVNARQSGDVPGPNSEKYRTEIQQAMFASGVTDEDVANAFANAPMQPVTPKTSTATSGLTFPLILSAIAAYFVLG